MTAPTPQLPNAVCHSPAFCAFSFFPSVFLRLFLFPPKIRASHDFGNCLSPVQYNTLPVGWKGQAGALRADSYPFSRLFFRSFYPYGYSICTRH